MVKLIISWKYSFVPQYLFTVKMLTCEYRVSLLCFIED